MIDFDKKIYFSCPDECGQIAVPCTIRMILGNEVFFCESCGCEFHGEDFPEWLSRAVHESGSVLLPEYEVILSLYSYLFSKGDCPSKQVLSQLLCVDRNLWKLFPAEKFPVADMLKLMDDAEFCSRLDYSLLNSDQFVGLLSSRPDLLISNPELEQVYHWNSLSSSQWATLLIALPNSKIVREHCDWCKINEADWERIHAGTNDYANAIYRVRHGMAISASIRKYPEIIKYIKWTNIAIDEWLNLLADFPQFVNELSWDKMYEYIVNLPPTQRQSAKDHHPQLWNKKSEILRHVDFITLRKLPADKYYTILDFFDWEVFFDYASLSQEERIDLFSKHPQFGEQFGWDNLSSDEKVALTLRNEEFGTFYGWENFSEDEILKILNEKPNYLNNFNAKKFNRAFLRKLIGSNDRFADYYKLNIWDYLFFRKFNSAKLCSKITFIWHFFISVLAFAGFGYLLYDGPCGFESLWLESHRNAVYAAVIYGAIAILWSYVHAWLFSGRSPFLLTIVSAMLGGVVAAMQYGYTFFMSKITLSNFICAGALAALIIFLSIVKIHDNNHELCIENKSGLKILCIFYLPVLSLTIAFCQPLFQWQFLKIYEQITNSRHPFLSAANYYLKKAFISDTDTQRVIAKLESSLQDADYNECAELFARVPAAYASLPKIIELDNKLANIKKEQLRKYTGAAIDAYSNNDYSKLADTIAKADTGNAEIQFILGKCYQKGLAGYKVDFAKAVEWYQRAVAQNHAGAMNNLGTLYMEGKGVVKSSSKAFSLYTSSAQFGCAVAQRNLAYMYLSGNGVQKNEKNAYEWFLKAANNNDAISQRQVALLSYCSMGTQRNDKEILMWLQKASEQNDSVAQQMLGAFYLTGVLGVQDNHIAIELLSKSAEQNNSSAQALLGLCYAEGKAVEVDGPMAIHWLSKAAEQNDRDAQYALFEIYYSGKIVPKDIALAVTYLKKSAVSNSTAQRQLGICYWNGEGVEKNIALAEDWLQKAHSNGDTKAQETLKMIRQQIKEQKERERLELERKRQEELNRKYRVAGEKSRQFFKEGKYESALHWGLQASPSDWEIVCNIALMYFKGWGTTQNYEKSFEYAKRAADANYARGYYLVAWYYDRKKNMGEAFKYYKKSAERGWLDGQYDVGCCYIFGDGCLVNYSQAHYWFSKAAEHNHAGAENNLGQMYLKGHGVRKDINTAKKWFKRAAAHGSEDAKRTLLTL